MGGFKVQAIKIPETAHPIKKIETIEQRFYDLSDVAPEVLEGREHDQSTDIYALG